MSKSIKAAAAAVMAALALSLGGVSWYAFSTPPSDPLALPPALVDASSAEGQRLLAAAAQADYRQMLPHFVAQSRRGFCGAATGSMVVNATLGPQRATTQADFFGADIPGLQANLAVTLRGMTLDQLAQFLRTHGLAVQVVHAADSTPDAFRAFARTTLAEPNVLLVVNYHRQRLGQEGAGHISPIGAYSAQSDRVLIMDVAAHRYPFTWVPIADLWSAMHSIDPDSGRTRGFLLVRQAVR